ncbi:MAG: hypothetical protein R3C56_21920 [Pirellulaceae bacterium]
MAAVAIIVWLHKFRAIDSWWLVIALACVMGGIFGISTIGWDYGTLRQKCP